MMPNCQNHSVRLKRMPVCFSKLCACFGIRPMAFSCKYVNVMNGAMFQPFADKTISDTARIMRENNDRQDPTCQFLIPVRADF